MRLSFSGLLLMLGMLFGCYPKGDPSKPIPTAFLPAPQPARRLVVVLPGRGDGLDALQRTGIAQAIQAQWPDADVVLSGLAIGYYLKGGAIQRLHDEIVMPARTRGYREIWLLGASLGGLGALMYDGRWPGTVDGLVLMAPYLGEKPLLQEIAAAGGIAKWNPGPVPPQVNGDNFQHELWRDLQALVARPGACAPRLARLRQPGLPARHDAVAGAAVTAVACPGARRAACVDRVDAGNPRDSRGHRRRATSALAVTQPEQRRTLIGEDAGGDAAFDRDHDPHFVLPLPLMTHLHDGHPEIGQVHVGDLRDHPGHRRLGNHRTRQFEHHQDLAQPCVARQGHVVPPAPQCRIGVAAFATDVRAQHPMDGAIDRHRHRAEVAFDHFGCLSGQFNRDHEALPVAVGAITMRLP